MALSDLMNGIDVSGDLPDLSVSGLSHDSRQIGDRFAFVALPGLTVQGTDYIDEAAAAGASVAIGPAIESPDQSAIPYIAIDNPAIGYSRMAANFYGHPSRDLKMVGITGTNGKTTTAELVTAILNAAQVKAATLGTLGARWSGTQKSLGYTTPDPATLQRILAEVLQSGYHGVALEVSSHALHQHRTDDVDFDVAVFTNLTQDHLDYHGSMDAYLEAKQRLFATLSPDGIAVLNADDPASALIASTVSGRVLTYGLSSDADLQVTNLGMNLERTVASLKFGDMRFDIESRLVGSYNLSNILAAALAGLALDLTPDAIVAGVGAVQVVWGRLERIASPARGQVMVDYAHTPDAFHNVLGTLKQLAGDDTPITLLFGCGGDRDRAKRPLMAQAAEAYAERIIVTSDNPRTEPLTQIMDDISAGFAGDSHIIIPNRAEALAYALREQTDGSLLLVLGKGREAYEIIGTEKLTHNDVAIIENFVQ